MAADTDTLCINNGQFIFPFDIPPTANPQQLYEIDIWSNPISIFFLQFICMKETQCHCWNDLALTKSYIRLQMLLMMAIWLI